MILDMEEKEKGRMNLRENDKPRKWEKKIMKKN